MDESGAYTEQFLIPFRERLDQLRSVIKQDSLEGKHPEPIVRLMIRKLEGVGKFLLPLIPKVFSSIFSSENYFRTPTRRTFPITHRPIRRTRPYPPTPRPTP